jgi:nucleotide-binding universal stress UspA family protein
MKDQILVPLDGSELAERVLPTAISFAHITGSSIVLLHAMSTLSVSETIGGIFPATPSVWDNWDDETRSAQSYLDSIAKQLTGLKLTVQTEVVEGQAATAIVKYAREHSPVRLIAMATHGRNGLGRLVLGSVADRVLHLSPVPMLLVRIAGHHDTVTLEQTDAVRITYKTILVPLDSSRLAEQALGHAVSLASKMDTTLLLVTALPNAQGGASISDEYAPPLLEEVQRSESNRLKTYLLGVAQKLRNRGLKVQTETPTGAPAAAVLHTALKTRTDLIVMTTHGRSGLQRLWLGSVAANIVHQSTCPVLLIRADELGTQEQPFTDIPVEQPTLEEGVPR